MSPPAVHGLLVLNKPGGITSRDAVNRAQRWFSRGTRVGHAGTLDPLATGVLVLCVGAATRLTEYVQQMAKTYRTRLLLGARSDTDDADGTLTPVEGARPAARAAVEEALAGFVGDIEQVPPAYSAAHVAGRRAHELARGGEEVNLAPRRVRVHGIDLLVYDYPHLELEVRCGKGTYIRSLARDLGERLGCGAYVVTLHRARVGPFDADSAVGMDADPSEVRARLLPVAAAVSGLPRVSVNAAQVRRLRQGQGIPLGQVVRGEPPAAGAEVAVFAEGGSLVAVATVDGGRGLLRPSKVLSS
jgi:tRNA pseudouridine55 synthase